MKKLRAFGYEYSENGIMLTIVYEKDGKTQTAKKFYENATEINFGWEEEARKIVSRDVGFKNE